MKKLFAVVLVLLIGAVPVSTLAKVKVIQKPDGSYNLKEIQNIIVPPVTSNNTDFGNVATKRQPKINAIMDKVKGIVRRNTVDGHNKSNATIGFHYNPISSGKPTAMLYINIDQFDNGNMIARKIPFAGKAKVTLRGKLVDTKTKKVITEFTTNQNAKGGMTGASLNFGKAKLGALESDILLKCSYEASGQINKHLKKLIGYKVQRLANAGEKAKAQAKEMGSVLKEEKREIER